LKSYHRPNKRIGIGGMKCVCCNIFRSHNSNKTTKQKINRMVRRTYRIEECEVVASH
jgi:hypothetical protein